MEPESEFFYFASTLPPRFFKWEDPDINKFKRHTVEAAVQTYHYTRKNNLYVYLVQADKILWPIIFPKELLIDL